MISVLPIRSISPLQIPMDAFLVSALVLLNNANPPIWEESMSNWTIELERGKKRGNHRIGVTEWDIPVRCKDKRKKP